MKKILLCSLGIFLLIFLSVNARASIVYEQSPHQTAGALVSSPSWSIYPGAQVYDDFTLPSASSITGINWWGHYMFPSSPTPAFTLTLYAYNNGSPGSGVEVSYSSLSATADSGVYKYSSVLAAPLDLTANTYWLSIYNAASDSSWGWQRAYPADYGIYGGSIQTGQDGIQSNVAFELASADSPVPIPSAAWLLASGLIGLVVIRRRIRMRSGR